MDNVIKLFRYNIDRSEAKVALPHIKKTLVFAILAAIFTAHFTDTDFSGLSTFLLIFGFYGVFRNFHNFMTIRISNQLTEEVFSLDKRLLKLAEYIFDFNGRHEYIMDRSPLFSWSEMIIFRSFLRTAKEASNLTLAMALCEYTFVNKTKLKEEWLSNVILPCMERNGCKVGEHNEGHYGRFLIVMILIAFTVEGYLHKGAVINRLERIADKGDREVRKLIHLIMNCIHNTPQWLFDELVEVSPTDLKRETAGELAVELGFVKTPQEFYDTLPR